jgi:serine/threonine protein kinase
MFDDDEVQSQWDMDFKYYQQESPFFFKGIDSGNGSNQGTVVFCKVWCEGDRHTCRRNVEQEIRLYKKANANNVPSPCVIDRLTALDVNCSVVLHGESVISIYHVLVTEYHRDDAVDENDVTVFALSLVRAVQKLHNIGILHCDIKRSNVLWDATQKMVLLIDFEHAQEEENAKWYTTTQKYEAPEITLGKPHTRKSDAYSVGKTLAAVIKDFENPVLPNIAAVLESLLIDSEINRLTLMEAERQLVNISRETTRNLVTELSGSSCLPVKRHRDEISVNVLKV